MSWTDEDLLGMRMLRLLSFKKKKTFPKQQRTIHPFARLPVCRKTSLTTGLVFRRGPHSAIAHPIRLYSRFLPLFFKKKRKEKKRNYNINWLFSGCSLAHIHISSSNSHHHLRWALTRGHQSAVCCCCSRSAFVCNNRRRAEEFRTGDLFL
jgi:hypothetical protein